MQARAGDGLGGDAGHLIGGVQAEVIGDQTPPLIQQDRHHGTGDRAILQPAARSGVDHRDGFGQDRGIGLETLFDVGGFGAVGQA